MYDILYIIICLHHSTSTCINHHTLDILVLVQISWRPSIDTTVDLWIMCVCVLECFMQFETNLPFNLILGFGGLLTRIWPRSKAYLGRRAANVRVCRRVQVIQWEKWNKMNSVNLWFRESMRNQAHWDSPLWLSIFNHKMKKKSVFCALGLLSWLGNWPCQMQLSLKVCMLRLFLSFFSHYAVSRTVEIIQRLYLALSCIPAKLVCGLNRRPSEPGLRTT